MATALMTDQVVELKVASFCGVQLGLNVRHYVVGATTGASRTDQNFADFMAAALAPAYKDYLGNDASFYGVSVQVLNREPRLLPVVNSANAGTGLGTGGSLPGQVSGVVTLRTAFSGRAYRGRMYLPFPGTALNDAVLNKPTDAAVLLMEIIGELFVNQVSLASGGDSAILDPILKSSDSFLYTTLEEAEARQRWGTQKRRGNYGRPNVFPPFE